MLTKLIDQTKRAIKKPPNIIAYRIWQELKILHERKTYKNTYQKFLFDWEKHWSHFAKMPYIINPTPVAPDKITIISLAQKVLLHQVNLLGSGDIDLGENIDWLKDYKTNIRWEPNYCRDIEYSNLDQPSDVKFPWELSRMQWMLPLAQAYQLTKEELYAEKAKLLILDWIAKNPYAGSVNWSCTMEVAMRIVTWISFFYLLHSSTAWQDKNFQSLFLQSLYSHCYFTAHHLERSDINGNHYVANGVGLIFGGLFFSGLSHAAKWLAEGKKLLETEILLQVFPDGVDYEASVPYHRLVSELFFFSALFLEKRGHSISKTYRDRLSKMAEFTNAYIQPDGMCPLIGDADDARVLPLGQHPINDHRYLPLLIGLFLQKPELYQHRTSFSEVTWFFNTIPYQPLADTTSKAFPGGGFYILKNSIDHIFIDCGPAGLNGRGGHGHNDCLSFEAVLNNQKLITDCGAYVYTADYIKRNAFRSTAFHNTPQIDNIELNRFISPTHLWNLIEDVQPIIVEKFFDDGVITQLIASHHSYQKLSDPVLVKRQWQLCHKTHTLEIIDVLRGKNVHDFKIPYHFEPGLQLELNLTHNQLQIISHDKKYLLTWDSDIPCKVELLPIRISPSYGVLKESLKILFSARASSWNLKIRLSPCGKNI